jgi:hypothetical protein
MIRTLYARLPAIVDVVSARTWQEVAVPRRALGVPVLLGAAWLGVVLWHLRMPYPSDQLHYLEAGAAFPWAPDNAELAHQVLRFGVTVPTRLAIAVFGYSQAAYYTVPVLASLLLLGATYALGALLFSRTVGVAAAAVVITSTPVFLDVTDLLPDLLATGLFTAAVAVAVAVRRGDLPARAPVLLTIGLLLGWSYLSREFIVFVWPLVPLLLWRPLAAGGTRWAGLAWMAAPIVGVVAAETLLCWTFHGDPLARFTAAAGHGEAPSPADIAATYRDKPRDVYLRRLWATLGGYPPGPRYPEGWILRGLLVLAVVAGLLRPRRLGVPLAWCALLWVPLTMLGGILDPAAPKLRLQLVRYWFPIFPAFVLGGLGALWLAARALQGWYERRPGPDPAGAAASGPPRPGGDATPRGPAFRHAAPIRAAVAVLPAAVVLAAGGLSSGTAMAGWWGDPATRAGGATHMERFRDWMGRQDADIDAVWADGRTHGVLQIFRQGPYGGRAWSAEPLRLGPRGDGPAPGHLVVLFDTERGEVCGACRAAAQDLLGPGAAPRPQWRQVFATRDGVLRAYVVGRH